MQSVAGYNNLLKHYTCLCQVDRLSMTDRSARVVLRHVDRSARVVVRHVDRLSVTDRSARVVVRHVDRLSVKCQMSNEHL